LTDLPVALVPLWQLAQLLEAVNVEWLTLVPVQVVVDWWQVSQAAVVETCVLGLPVPTDPLWQLAQLLVTVTLMWNLAGSQFG
jgi:hypothetical protein